MSWAAGTFTRSNGVYSGSGVWASDEAAAVDIESARHDTHDQDLATGINSCIHKGGQNAATADLGMGGFKHTNVANATARTNYGVVGQIQDGTYHWGGTSTGSSGTFAITASPTITAYAAGQMFRFLANHSNVGAATLNVSALGAKDIKAFGGVLALNGMRASILSGSLIEVVYDGTQFVFINPRFAMDLYAAAGTSQGAAQAITTPYVWCNSFTGGSAEGLRLPDVGAQGFAVSVHQGAVGTLRIYPASGDQIDSLGTNVADTITNGVGKTYVVYSTGPLRWYGFAA